MHINIKVSVLIGVTTSIAFILGVSAGSVINFHSVQEAQKLAKDTIQACEDYNTSSDLGVVKLKLSLFKMVAKREELTSDGWKDLEAYSREMISRERVDLAIKIGNDASDEYITKAKVLLEDIDNSLVKSGI
jgi:hypothetical protein